MNKAATEARTQEPGLELANACVRLCAAQSFSDAVSRKGTAMAFQAMAQGGPQQWPEEGEHARLELAAAKEAFRVALNEYVTAHPESVPRYDFAMPDALAATADDIDQVARWGMRL